MRVFGLLGVDLFALALLRLAGRLEIVGADFLTRVVVDLDVRGALRLRGVSRLFAKSASLV